MGPDVHQSDTLLKLIHILKAKKLAEFTFTFKKLVEKVCNFFVTNVRKS